MDSLQRAIPRIVHSPLLHVAIPGLLSWLIYLRFALDYPLNTFVTKYPLTDYARVNDWSRPALAGLVVAVICSVVLYFVAWRVVRGRPRDRRLLWLVIGIGLLCALTLLWMYPITATDIFEYVFHSRILVHYGQNPLSVPPVAFKGDPFLKTVNWAAHPSPYGPLWVLLTVPGTSIAGDDLTLNLYAMRTMAVLFYFGCTLLIAAILKEKNPEHQVGGTLLFAWNPLILFEAPGNGHNGIIMMFFALLAIYLLVKRRWVWVIPALVASLLIKYITAILLIPFLIYCWRMQEGRRNQFIYLFKTGLVSTLLVVVLALPFLSVPSGLLEEANFYSLLAVPTVAYNILKGAYGDKIAKVITIGTGVVSYLALYALSLRSLPRLPRPRNLIVLSTWLIVSYLGIACMHYQPWFTVWPIALGIWINHSLVRRVLITFTLSALLSYATNFIWVWNLETWQPLQVNVIYALTIFVPPLVIGLGSLAWERHLAPSRLSSPPPAQAQIA